MPPASSRPLAALLALAIPTLFALGAFARPRVAERFSLVSLALASLFAATLFAHGARLDSVALGVRADAITAVMLVLVSALGAVVVRYSRTYLDGDPGLPRYSRWLLLTLSSVTSLIVANNLLVMALAWSATSVALHQLLTYYDDRIAALVAAHKKFLVSRLADLALVACLAITHRHVGTLQLDAIASWTAAQPQLPWSMELAALLLVLAVALRSAQLPFHGWLTQVMEAPTPVSALLHAGVVNMGGFVLLRVAPWISQSRAASLALVLIGLVSTVVAALVMTTRVSVKVSLAWSTCAQMGFMLVQCGLGLWSLALLHLVAHSLYKAHAFLSAGSVVDEWKTHSLAPPRAAPSVARWTLVSLSFVALAVAGVLFARSVSSAFSDVGSMVMAVLLGLAVVPLWAARGALFATALRTAGVALLYGAWHALAASLVRLPGTAPSTLSWALVAVALAALFVAKSALILRPDGPFARAAHPWLFAGLYLDERFTRATFRLWPPRLQRASRERSLSTPTSIEAEA